MTAVLPDGSAVISQQDVLTVLNALRDAAWWRTWSGNDSMAVRYKSLSYALGDDSA